MSYKELVKDLSVIKFKLANKIENLKLDSDKEIQGYFKEMTDVEMKLLDIQKKLEKLIN